MQTEQLRIIKIPFEVLSSKVFMIWCIGGWIVYYIFSAVWMSESFRKGHSRLYQILSYIVIAIIILTILWKVLP